MISISIREPTDWEEVPDGNLVLAVKRIGQRLSIQNRTLSPLYRRVELPALPWARPYVTMLANLMVELEVKPQR